MTEPVPDYLAALVAFLRAEDAVAALAATRIFGAELPAGEADSMPSAAIVVSPAGAAGAIGSGYQLYGDKRIDLRAYGATPKSAHDLYLAAHPALKHLTRAVHAECLLHWARPAGGPLTLRDPETDWPFVLSTWQVMVGEVAAV